MAEKSRAELARELLREFDRRAPPMLAKLQEVCVSATLREPEDILFRLHGAIEGAVDLLSKLADFCESHSIGLGAPGFNQAVMLADPAFMRFRYDLPQDIASLFNIQRDIHFQYTWHIDSTVKAQHGLTRNLYSKMGTAAAGCLGSMMRSSAHLTTSYLRKAHNNVRRVELAIRISDTQTSEVVPAPAPEPEVKAEAAPEKEPEGEAAPEPEGETRASREKKDLISWMMRNAKTEEE